MPNETAVFSRRSAARSPTELLADFETNAFVKPSATSAKILMAWDRVVAESLPESFEFLELSSVSPLGTNAVVAPISQDRTLMTARGIEVLSDPSSVLMLEAARRRKAGVAPEVVRLATSHRVLRPQFRASPYFRLFALCTAFPQPPEVETRALLMAEHLQTYLRAIHRFIGRDCGIILSLTDLAHSTPDPRWSAPISRAIEQHGGNVELRFDQDRQRGRNYYRCICFKLYLRAEAGEIEVADGGAVDWSEKLLSNAREHGLISGIGAERICEMRNHFPAANPT